MIIIYTTFISITIAIMLYIFFRFLTRKEGNISHVYALYGLISYAIFNLNGQKAIRTLMDISDQGVLQIKVVLLYLLEYYAGIIMGSIAVFFTCHFLLQRGPKSDDLFIRNLFLLCCIVVCTLLISNLIIAYHYSNLPYQEIVKGGY